MGMQDKIGAVLSQGVQRGDVPGFWTSFDRFVTRDEAKLIGEVSGQCSPQQRELLSSDVRW